MVYSVKSSVLASSSHLSVTWTLWRIILQTRWYIFHALKNLKVSFFVHILMISGKWWKLYLNIYYILSTLKNSLSHLYEPYEISNISGLQLKVLLLRKIKYFANISSTWKNKGYDLKPGCYASKLFLFPLHHTSLWYVFTWRGISWLVLAFLMFSQHQDRNIFILGIQEHSHILTNEGHLLAASQLDAGIIAIVHWASTGLGMVQSALLFNYIISIL